MSAFVVMLRERTTDEGEMSTYRQLAPAARDGRDITPLAAYGDVEVLEGPALEGVLINRFASMEDAREWYRSKDYQRAAAHRHRGADYRVLLVDGVDIGPSI